MINLFYNYYKDKNPQRQKEIDLCLNNNLKNKYLNVIVLENQERLQFSYFFKKINLITMPDDINIICNSDIYLDHTINICNGMKINDCYALTRWDVLSNGKLSFFNRPDSQDTWIFKGHIKNEVYGDIYLGLPGCDNRIAYEISRAGYLLTNPSKAIKSYHIHSSNLRNYSNVDRVPGPYKTITPTEVI